MMYQDIVRKYLHYMSKKGLIKAEDELILRSALVDCSPDVDYREVFEKYCKGNMSLIPLSY